MLQGANFVLLYALAWYALAPVIERQRALAAAVIAGVGIVGGGHLGLVGTIFYDNVVSLLVFAALGVVLASIDVLREGALRSALARCALAGFFVGCGVGLKLPTQIFAIGVCFGLLFVPGPFMRRFWMSFVCGLGVIAGAARGDAQGENGGERQTAGKGWQGHALVSQNASSNSGP